MLWSLLEVWWWEEYDVVKSAGASAMGEVGCRGVCSSFGNECGIVNVELIRSSEVEKSLQAVTVREQNFVKLINLWQWESRMLWGLLDLWHRKSRMF